MMLLEHDAKTLLAERGMPVPDGYLVHEANASQLSPPAERCVVKAQVPVGGRGKAGGVVKVHSAQEISREVSRLIGTTLKGHFVRECRVEEQIDGIEVYLGLLLDPSQGQLHVMLSKKGGVDVELNTRCGELISRVVDCNRPAAIAAIYDLAAVMPTPIRRAVEKAAPMVSDIFFSFEATLFEINPFFVRQDGTWVVGDVKLAVDANAFVRIPTLARLMRQRSRGYAEASFKMESGFDFFVLNPDGDIGLVTTGAGLSMQLVDELVQRGHHPFNFCDIRSGQFNGDPTRLVQALRKISAGVGVRSILMNFFGGITQLGDLSRVLVAALNTVSDLRVPITVRLIGNGYEEAIAILEAAGKPLRVESDLDIAIASAIEGAGS